MRMYDIIEKKRDGYALSYDELSFFINGYCSGTIPDYQASALLMAVFFKGLDGRETAELTEIMSDSGDTVDLSSIPGVKVDKHSTGGVGDKTTLVLAPIVAACGVPVAKMSGRGLGHTGGTIDKLEAIPGFKTAISREEFLSNVSDIGISIAGQSGNLVPADKKIYALRDVTATVNNLSLIASSIMSKKIASGADAIVLDVKCGSGAFMKTIEDAAALAKAMVEIGERVGRKTVAVVTEMDVPLGNAIGNSLEVIEAIDTLKGKGPEDLEQVSFELAAKMLELAGKGTPEICMNMVKEVISNGKALKKLSEMIVRQGGDSEVVNDYGKFGKAVIEHEVFADEEGYINSIKTDSLGISAMILGAGRETKESSIDYTAGILLNKKTGMNVKKGDLLAKFYTSSKDRIAEAERIFMNSLTFSDRKTDMKPLILASVDSGGVHLR
jgi:pyrimidine-nucleoside phosphorylase